MRQDLTPAFIAAKNGAFRRPRQLLVFKFPEAGNVYLSDQALGAADGLSKTYLPLVESWGELQDTAGEATAVDNGEIRQMSVTLWNGGTHPFSDYFLAEYPENVEVELYQWFAGLAETDKALVDRFVVSDPIEFDEASRLLRLDLVSISIRYDQPCGDLITRDVWPYAADSDIGKGIPQAFGGTGRIPALKGKTSQTLRLKGSILNNTMYLDVYEDLDELLFPASGTVLIDEEKIRYSGRSASRLIVIQRGYLSSAAEHLDKREIVSVINDHTFLLCGGPVAAIANVMIEGYPAPAGIYTVRADLDPARVIFSEKPWVKKYGESTRFLEMQFDGVTSSNTALQPAYAYDAADLATAACIKSGNNVLGLRQVTVNRNRGEILRAYLAVEHWESGRFLSDYVEVWVSGLGVVGRLSRPNPNDEIALDADVDVDHGHSHEIGGEHIHNFDQPAVTTSDPEHPHSTEATAGMSANGTPSSFSHGISSSGGGYGTVKETTVWFNSLEPAALSSSISINVTTIRSGATAKIDFIELITEWGGTVLLDQFDPYTGAAGNITVSGGGWSSGGTAENYRLKVRTALYANDGSITVYYKIPVINYASRVKQVTSNATGVTASASGGKVKDTGVVNVKNSNDVVPLAITNRTVNTGPLTEDPTRTVVNLFDLTNHVNFDWGWFTGREIAITYVNAGDARAVYILHAFFDVEYVPTEVVYSNEITAEVTSLTDRIRPDLAVKKLLTSRAGVAVGDFDSASFAAVAAKFTALGYRLDGLIEAEASVREAIKRICYQSHSRVFTSGGKLKMVLREGHPESKPVARQLVGDNLQLRSIKVARQPLREISNRVQLFFKRDWTAAVSTASGFLDSVTREDAGSINTFGLKARADSYNFDLLRDGAMAAKVADFYLMTEAWPSSFYTFMAYLDQFDLEKEDVIEVSAGFNRMQKVPMVLRAMDRLFGSGKNQSINLVRIVAENLYYILKEVSRADAVLVMDTLSFMITEIGEYADAVHVLEELLVQLQLHRDEAVTVSDALLSIWEMRRDLAEAVTATEAVHTDQDSRRCDAVVVEDFPEFWSVYGFGSGAFGQVMFGGLSAWRQKSPDQISIFEQLLTALSAVRVSTVEPSDQLVIGSGFGGKVSSGFGLSLFGG
jgi:hypothetical protein